MRSLAVLAVVGAAAAFAPAYQPRHPRVGATVGRAAADDVQAAYMDYMAKSHVAKAEAVAAATAPLKAQIAELTKALADAKGGVPTAAEADASLAAENAVLRADLQAFKDLTQRLIVQKPSERDGAATTAAGGAEDPALAERRAKLEARIAHLEALTAGAPAVAADGAADGDAAAVAEAEPAAPAYHPSYTAVPERKGWSARWGPEETARRDNPAMAAVLGSGAARTNAAYDARAKNNNLSARWGAEEVVRTAGAAQPAAAGTAVAAPAAAAAAVPVAAAPAGGAAAAKAARQQLVAKIPWGALEHAGAN